MTGDSRLSMSVTHADGRVTRWGPDELNATDIPGDLTFSTAIPGGFRDMSCSLLRRIDVEYPDQALYDSVRVYGPGNRTVWEGRMQQFPRQHGSGFQITPGAVGWSAHLRDDPSFREIYVDRDMTHWTEASLVRRAQLAVGGAPQGKIQITIGSGGVSWDIPNESLPGAETAEVFYDCGPGLAISAVQYRGARTGAFTSFEAATMYGDAATTLGSPTSVALTLDNTIRNATGFVASDRYAMIRARTTAVVTPAAGHQQRFDLLGVFGIHGLVPRAVAGDGHGVLASDVIADVVGRVAPLLTTTGIESSAGFVIPHLVFLDPVTAEDAILQTNAYHLWDWGVYDNQEFFYRQPDPDRLTWEARLSDGAQIDLEGDTADSVYNGVLVSYTDPTGLRQVVGPPAAYWSGGVALADSTDAALVDTDATNPLNAHSIPRRWGKLEISFPTNAAGATQLGVVWLAERRLASRRGSLKLTGTATHPTEGQVPVWRVRAGDYIRIADHPADVPRRIISTTYTHSDGGLSCDLDNTPNKIDAIMERIGVRQVGVF